MAELSFPVSANAALVTGSGSGIGRAISIALAKAGVPVAVVAHRAESIPPVISEIEAAGGRCVGYAVDVSDGSAIDRLVGQVEATIGPIDILVSCAGIYPRSTVADMAPANGIACLASTWAGSSTAPTPSCRR